MTPAQPTTQGRNARQDAVTSEPFPGHQIGTQTDVLRCPKCRHAVIAAGPATCVQCARPMQPVRGRDA